MKYNIWNKVSERCFSLVCNRPMSLKQVVIVSLPNVNVKCPCMGMTLKTDIPYRRKFSMLMISHCSMVISAKHRFYFATLDWQWLCFHIYLVKKFKSEDFYSRIKSLKIFFSAPKHLADKLQSYTCICKVMSKHCCLYWCLYSQNISNIQNL